MASSSLKDLVWPQERFARSVNVERDSGTKAIDGYLPTGRGLDVIRRVVRSMVDTSSSRALSITGPYGSGKSSLAVFVDALTSPRDSEAARAAFEILRASDPDTAALFETAKAHLGATDRGFIRCVVTAQREPVAHTIVRALERGVKSSRRRMPRQVSSLVSSIEQGELISTRSIRDAAARLAADAPVLIVLDEFGKCLESFAESGSEADPFLLQELAEWTAGEAGLPLFVMTLQHLAFEDYVTGVSTAQRREWAKVQGRFEDIPYTDTPTQSRNLIAAALTQTDELAALLAPWSEGLAQRCRAMQLPGGLADAQLLASCYPLHPVSLLVLPELCARYGQNERTMFSFLASSEPLALSAFLEGHALDPKPPFDPPLVRLDRVYDYFLESAASMVGASQSASRWLEVETTIRDAHGLTEAERRLLKSIGVLNLVSTGGALRASRELLAFASADDVDALLDGLVAKGLVTYRDFADDFRIWRGSDFDIRTHLEVARRRISQGSIAELLEAVRPLGAAIAARHSQQTGTLRIFTRRWVDGQTSTVDYPDLLGPIDGIVLYDVTGDFDAEHIIETPSGPVVVSRSGDSADLVEAAIEAGAIEALLDDPDVEIDWVARKELLERGALAQQQLDRSFEGAFGAHSSARWSHVVTGGHVQELGGVRTTAVALSEVADATYAATPQIPNEMLNRSELSSQGARARRVLLEALLENVEQPLLGIEGYGPERAMYEAALHKPGIHRAGREAWHLTAPPPDSPAREAWDRIVHEFRLARDSRRRLDDVYRALAAPPIGMKAGPLPVLLTAALMLHADEVALYEHGTFKPVLTAELSERMVRNPRHFEIKHFGSRTGARRAFIEAAGAVLGVRSRSAHQRVSSVLAIVGNLVATANMLPDYTKRTDTLSRQAQALRDALFVATEPDDLLFRALPEALGHPPISGKAGDVEETAAALGEVVAELRGAYPALLDHITSSLQERLAAPSDNLRTSLLVRASALAGKLLDPRVRAFAGSLSSDTLGDEEWLEYVAMTVVDRPPAAWTAEDRVRFDVVLGELAGTFRRLEALHFDQQAIVHGGFTPVRLTVTRPDGTEAAQVVAAPDELYELVRSLADEAVDQVEQLAGSRARAREALLAVLASELLPVAITPDVRPGRENGPESPDERNGTDG